MKEVSSENISIAVIGGGIAGLAAAVFLAEKNYCVTLIEASQKLGGRAYSFFDNVTFGYIDNGQHLLAGWYKTTMEFLDIIDSRDKLFIQKQLKVVFRNKNSEEFVFECPDVKSPFNLLEGIMRYKALTFSERIRFTNFCRKLLNGKYNRIEYRKHTVTHILKESNQSEAAIEYFWKPFCLAVFNAPPERISTVYFTNIVKNGFSDNSDAVLIKPKVFLSELFAEPAVKYLSGKNSQIILNKRVVNLKIVSDKIHSLVLNDGSIISADYFISAVSFSEFEQTLNCIELENENEMAKRLKPSPIVNIHMKYETSIDRIFREEFYGLIGTITQWIFKVNSFQLCCVISSADKISSLSSDEIFNIVLSDLNNTFPESVECKIISHRIIKEMRATFVPDSDSLHNRPEYHTEIKNLFLTGDWTNTRLPATIEGAVLSSKKCVNEILKILNN